MNANIKTEGYESGEFIVVEGRCDSCGDRYLVTTKIGQEEIFCTLLRDGVTVHHATDMPVANGVHTTAIPVGRKSAPFKGFNEVDP